MEREEDLVEQILNCFNAFRQPVKNNDVIHHARHHHDSKITRAQIPILSHLVSREDKGLPPAKVSELSRMLGVSPPSASQIIDGMVDSGLLERVADESDRRVVALHLTPKGREIAQDMVAQMRETMSGLVAYLGVKDSKALVRLAQRCVEYFHTHDHPHLPPHSHCPKEE